MDPGILSVIRESRVITANNREHFIQNLPYFSGRKRWRFGIAPTDVATIDGDVTSEHEDFQHHQVFFVLYNTKPTWVKDCQWCFIAADPRYSTFVLAWRVGRSTAQPHKTWFAFVEPDIAYAQASRGDFSQFELRFIHECLLLDAPLACSQRKQRIFMELLGEPREAIEEHNVIQIE